MTSPLLVVLNTENFEEIRKNLGGGGVKDFFANSDIEFEIHKANLIKQIESAIEVLESQPQGPIGFLKVVLRREAWAKSHRPVRTLFKKNITPLVGGADIGEMIFEVQPESLELVKNTIISAEPDTQFVIRYGKRVPTPSTIRSETGAISSISLFGRIDKRSFSVKDAVKWLSNPNSGGSYEVELFDRLHNENEWKSLDEHHKSLHKSFADGFREHLRGVEIYSIPYLHQKATILKIRLNSSNNESIIRLENYETKKRQTPISFENNEDKHWNLLNFLDSHPLVRRIELPVLISHHESLESKKI